MIRLRGLKVKTVRCHFSTGEPDSTDP